MDRMVRDNSSPNLVAEIQTTNCGLRMLEPSAPTLLNLHRSLETPQKTVSAKVDAWQEALDEYANRKAHNQPLPTLDYTLAHPFFSAEINRNWFTWPQNLFIPSAADSTKYWFTDCPPDHRFQYEWITGQGSQSNQANKGDGHILASAVAIPSDVLLRSQAGVGFLFAPPATLAVYKIQPAMTIKGGYRWNVGQKSPNARPPAGWGGTIRVQGFLYTSAWIINPLDGSLELIRPYGVSPMIFDEINSGLGGQDARYPEPSWRPGPPATNLMLEGGRRYLIGVIAAAYIDNEWTDGHGHHISSMQSDITWQNWCYSACTVDSISVDAATIYIP